MSEEFTKLISNILIIIIYTIIGLLIAFPIKWCWNYAIVYVSHLPTISWGHAWCIYFLIAQIKPVHLTVKNMFK